MKLAYNWIDKLLATPKKSNLMILNKVLPLAIPFNAPHGFKVLKLDREAVIITLPNRKLNHNHLGGIHACAIATVGEFCAGMSLLTSFGISAYRPILSELSVKYTYQGRTDLTGSCLPSQIQIDDAKKALEAEGKYLQKLETKLVDRSGKEVAVVTTIWQLKTWDKVKTKS